jgi:hypothetical protein
MDFDLNGPTTPTSGGKQTPKVTPDEEERHSATEMAELLAMHHRYGHISMRKLQETAAQGILPK